MAGQQGQQSTSSRSSIPPQTPGMDALAGAVANALMQSFSSVQGSINRSSATAELLNHHQSGDVPGTATTSVCINTASRSAQDRFESSREASSFQQASSVRQQSRHKRPRLTFEPPSLFESVRRRRSAISRQIPRSEASFSKTVNYSRDIILLPAEYKNSSGDVTIPRSGKRSLLGRAGLIGKVEIDSFMTDLDVRKEICEVFSVPMGITCDDIKHGHVFPFTYLQRAGSGTRTLCLPSVKPSFEWNGKQVASLAKAGSFIYVLAEADLPGYEALINQQNEGDAEEVDHKPENDDSSYADEELPDFSSVLRPVLESPSDVIEISSSPEQTQESHSEEPSNIDSNHDQLLPSTSSSIPTVPGQESELDHLIDLFEGEFSHKQIAAIYLLTGENYKCSVECLLQGPNSLHSILKIMNDSFARNPKVKVHVDPDSAWSDIVAFYKSSEVIDSCIRIVLAGGPAIDTGGVRRQIYTQVYTDFAENKYVELFDGPMNCLRPLCTAVARSSGLLKILGKMLAHSIRQDGIAFPYLSPVCFWYVIGGEDMAIQYATIDNLPADSASLIKEVRSANSDDEIKEIMQSESKSVIYEDILQRCGINQHIKMSNRDYILEEILSFESIGRIAKLLDQLSDGLKNLGILRIIRTFPNIFVHLFTCTKVVSATDVLDTLKISANHNLNDSITISYLRRFISEAPEEVLKRFLLYTTGSAYPAHTVDVAFSDDDEFGTITAHTCSREIFFPHAHFNIENEETFQAFSSSLMAVIESKTFNIV